MPQTPASPSQQQVVALFLKHALALYFHFHKDGDDRCFVISSFVVTIHEQWILVTAGHCIEEAHDLLTNGYELRKCRIFDGMGLEASHSDSIPFDFGVETATVLCQDPKFDYGLMFLPDNTVRLLRENGIAPLDEDTWRNPPSEPESFFVVGFPFELTKAHPNHLQITPTLHPIIELASPPDCFEPTDAPRFYGEILLPDGMTSILGLSGAPVLCLKEDKSGEFKYWLYAIQSRWVKSKRTIAACLMKPLGEFIEQFKEGKYSNLASDTSTES